MGKGGRRKLNIKALCLAFCLLFLLCGCGGGEVSSPNLTPVQTSSPPKENAEPTYVMLVPEASGVHVKENDKAIIDYSNFEDGYVMVKFKEDTGKRVKAQIKCSADTYTFDVKPGQWEVLPFGNGNDSYTVQLCENIEGNKYAVSIAEQIKVVLRDEFAPFIRPNQYVNYSGAEKTIKKAGELCAGRDDTLDKVEVVYHFVVGNFKYDMELANTVKSGYVPDLDKVLSTYKGICFDYASLMTGMLRCQGVPCKLVVGYAGDAYHAWISVWTEEEGWIGKAIFFDGTSWHRMDPTFASTGKNDPSVLKYIGDGNNYTDKYYY